MQTCSFRCNRSNPAGDAVDSLASYHASFCGPCHGSLRRAEPRHAIFACVPYASVVAAPRTHSLNVLLRRWCWQMLDPPHSLHVLLMRWCWQTPDPPHSLQVLLWRWCGHILVCAASAFMLCFFLLDPSCRCLVFASKLPGASACLRFFASKITWLKKNVCSPPPTETNLQVSNEF
jgi:hypothetical protein